MTERQPLPQESGRDLGDAGMVHRIWPMLLAAALGLVPFTVFSTFLVAITEETGDDAALVGSLRGLGGVAALLVGLAGAPLLDRLSRPRTAAVSAGVLGAGCLVALSGTTLSWTVFCLLVGAGTSLLNPAVSSMAADRFSDDAASARAATLVSSTTTLTAVLSAPVLAVPALWWGWRGDLVATALAFLLVGASMLRRAQSTAAPPAAPGARHGYIRSLRTALAVPGALALVGVSALRTAAFMGQLAYIAVYYGERHGVSGLWFSLVWALSGLSFFLGNWFGGKSLRGIRSTAAMLRVLTASSLVAAAAVLALFSARPLVLALFMTALLAASHAVVAACVTTLLVRSSTEHRGAVLSLNGSGQSVGVCLGASAAGFGLAAASWTGVGWCLAAVTAACALLGVAVGLHMRRLAADRPSPSGASSEESR